MGQYMNWRDHFVRRMMVRGLRRDQDLVDSALHAKALLRRVGLSKAKQRAAPQLPASLRDVHVHVAEKEVKHVIRGPLAVKGSVPANDVGRA